MSDTQELWYTLEMEIKEDKVDTFLEIFRPVSALTRKEAGVIQYDLLRDVKSPNKFNLVQRYASLEALRFHMSQEYTKQALGQLAGLLVKPYLQTDYAFAC